MNAYELSGKARKFLGRWSRDEWYVYIRATTSRYAEPTKPEGQWWVVGVECRTSPPQTFRGEGRSLDAVIRKLGADVPRRSDLKKKERQPRVNPDWPGSEHVGWLAPARLLDRKIASSRFRTSELWMAAMKREQEIIQDGKLEGGYGVSYMSEATAKKPSGKKKSGR